MATLSEVPQQQAAPQQLENAPFKSILLATDFSDASEKAFHYAAAIARLYGSKIFLVHALPAESISFIPELPLERDRRQAEQKMENLANRNELKEIAHETVLQGGPVWSVLADVIQQANIDLVVLGTHGRAGFSKFILGSVAEEVVRRADCPVTTVGPHLDAPLSTTREFHRILFATDFHPASAKALGYALLFANQPQANLILLHVMPPAALPGPGIRFYDEKAVQEWQARVRTTTQEKMAKLLPPDAPLRSEPEYEVRFDFIAEGILDVATERQADLIVMGVNRPVSAAISAHTPGTVSHEVIRRAKCAVLTART